MDGPDRSSDGLPLPRVRSLVLIAVIAVGAWVAWTVNETNRSRQALWDESARSAQRIRAAEEWAKLGAAAVPELVGRLDSPDAKTRELAAMALGRIRSDARSAGPALAELLADPSEAVRSAALRALLQVGYPPQ